MLKSVVDNAINIPRGVLEMKLLELEKDPQRPSYLHCATAGRATFGAEQLTLFGYENIRCISCKLDIVQSEF